MDLLYLMFIETISLLLPPWAHTQLSCSSMDAQTSILGGNVSSAAAFGSGVQWEEVNFWQYLLLENSDSIWRLMRWEMGETLCKDVPPQSWGPLLKWGWVGTCRAPCQRLASKQLQRSADFPRFGEYSGLLFIVNFRYTCPCCSSTHPLHTQQNMLVLIFISTSALLNQN